MFSLFTVYRYLAQLYANPEWKDHDPAELTNDLKHRVKCNWVSVARDGFGILSRCVYIYMHVCMYVYQGWIYESFEGGVGSWKRQSVGIFIPTSKKN